MGKSDIEIAREIKLQPIVTVAEGLGLTDGDLELYGRHKAKVRVETFERLRTRPDGALVLVTAMTPTPAGEGKSTTTVGLGDAFRRLGKRSIVTIREPSLGPCFGVKGGAAGGGYAQVVPMEDINLHFTGDLHAVTAAHNLLAAIVDNHIFQGNALGLDARRVLWKRVLDMNDRALRNLVIGLGGPVHGVPRESGFEITVASEIMAILCLATDLADLKRRIARAVVGERADGSLVNAGDLGVAGALAVLLRDAIKPNLVQTLEGTPAFVHGGPFANIAHGCNSLMATRLALKLGEVVVTEAGFASDLGAEKFFDIKCRAGGLTPAAAVIVATVRALKMHGGVARDQLDAGERGRGAGGPRKSREARRERQALRCGPGGGPQSLHRQIRMPRLRRSCARASVLGCPAAFSRVWERGGAGGTDLAEAVLRAMGAPNRPSFRPLYPDELPLAKKIETIATSLYGADSVSVLPAAQTKLTKYESLGYGQLPVCIAKTQNSLSDDPRKLGRPRGFTVTIRDAKLSAGAGFVVAYAGDILTMPGLPKKPAAESIDIDENGQIVGLF